MKRGARQILALLGLGISLCGCGNDELRAQRLVEHTFLDSMAVYLQNLRALDQQIGQVVMTDTVSSTRIVPLISERFRPVVAGLHQRAATLATTPKVAPVKEHLLEYLKVRLQAYDAAIGGLADDRPNLFDEFARKQAEADRLGRALELEIRQVRTRVPGYRP